MDDTWEAERARRRRKQREMYDRCKFIDELVDLLPAAVANGRAKLSSGTDDTTILSSPTGQRWAVFFRPNLGRFLLDATHNLVALRDYVRQLEAEAFDSRQRQRAWRRAEPKLHAAARAGLKTDEGRRLFGEAMADLRDRDWD